MFGLDLLVLMTNLMIVDNENVFIECEPVKGQDKCSDDRANKASNDPPKMRYSLRSNVKAPETCSVKCKC